MKKLLLILLFTPIFLFAQTPITTFPDVKYLDEVRMKNDYVYQGKIIEMGENIIVIDVLGGFRLHLNRAGIKTIRQKCLNCSDLQGKIASNYQFRETGYYSHLSIGAISGTIDAGIGAAWSIGKMQRRTFGYGGGIGIFSYKDNGNKYDFVPLFAEARSYFLAKKNTPFLTAKAGYGLPIKRALRAWEQQIDRQNGGLFFNPSFGFRFGANEDINMTLDLGFLVQYSKNEYILDSSGLGKSWQKRTFRRWNLNLGIVF